MTGPGLSEKGVPVEGDIRHSRIPYDKVFLNGVTFDKDWDTGLIIGGLQEGEYTLYLSTIEQNALNPREGTYTTAKIKITDSGNKKNKESPIPLSVIIISVISAAAITAKNRE
ncbi:MAG: hypothetical protein PHP13_00665 [Methanomicrobium sp.]|nr:hypothetical protein [Methanomicrobium sp.]MDD4299151.1 hypothetical protein [Methanomicrobium sp.]